MDTDEIDPPRPVAQTLNLDSMSIHELKDYILSLEAEIARARTTIEKKESHKSGAEGLFRSN